MDSRKRLSRRLLGKTVDRPPNFDLMMTFAAHHIGQPLSRYYLDYRILCEANLVVQQAFALDIVQAISDPYRETADFGAEIIFPEDGLPICKKPIISNLSDLHRLKPPESSTGARISDRLAAVRYLFEKVGGAIPVMGWVEGALAQAANLRGAQTLLLDLYDRPDWVQELLELCVEVEIAFARNQVLEGADIIGLGDAIASQISPEMYRRFALPYERRIFDAVHEAGALCRLHICGNTTQILADIANSGADIIDIDSMVDIHVASEKVGGRVAICGNINPVTIMLQGTPQQVQKAVLNCMQFGGRRIISAAGCEIPDGTPHENLLAQAQALEEYGQAC